MITKKDYCKYVLEEFARKEGIDVTDIRDMHILSSSNLGIAMEYLGLIQDEEMKEFVKSRVSSMIVTLTGKHLSAREFLSLIPEH